MAGEIPQFDAGLGKITPNDIGQQAAVMAGRRIGEFAHQEGEEFQQAANLAGRVYDDYQTNKQISAGMPAVIGAYTAFNQRLNDAIKNGDPNDPTLIPKIMQDWSDFSSDFQSKFTTDRSRDWARGQMEKFTDHFMTSAMADQSTQARVAAVQNVDSAVSQAGALAGDDISQLAVAHHMVDAAIDHVKSVSTMSPDDSAALEVQRHQQQSAVTYNAARQAMWKSQAGVDLVRQKLADPNWEKGLLDPAQRAELQGEANSADEHWQHEATFQQDQLDKKMKQDGAAAYADLDARVRAAGVPGAAPDPKLGGDLAAWRAKYAGYLPGEATTLNDGWSTIAQKRAETKLVPDDTPTARDVMGRLGGPTEYTDAQLSQMNFRGEISDHVLQIARDGMHIAKDPANKDIIDQFHAFQADLKGQIEKTGGRGAAAAVAAMQNDTQASFNRWVASGLSPAEALDVMRNPNNPKTFLHVLPDYLRAATNNNPIGALRGMPDYQVLQHNLYGELQPGAVSRGSPTSTQPGGAPDGPLSDEDSAAMAKIAGGR